MISQWINDSWHNKPSELKYQPQSSPLAWQQCRNKWLLHTAETCGVPVCVCVCVCVWGGGGEGGTHMLKYERKNATWIICVTTCHSNTPPQIPLQTIYAER